MSDIVVNSINYMTMRSLTELSSIAIAYRLYKVRGINDLVIRFGNASEEEFLQSFNEVKRSFSESLTAVGLPCTMIQKICALVKPIALEMIYWRRALCADDQFIDAVCWTACGFLDVNKTAKNVFEQNKCNLRSIDEKFNVATKFCVESSIIQLWREMPRELKKIPLRTAYPGVAYSYHFRIFWIHYCANKLDKLMPYLKKHDPKEIYVCNHSVYKNMYSVSVQCGNPAAAKYFWSKLTDEEKNDHVTEWIDSACRYCYFMQLVKRRNDHIHILCFLLSTMKDGVKQRDVIMKCCKLFLKPLALNWPYQKMLVPTINAIWNDLPETVYLDLMKCILFRSNYDKDIEDVFDDVWDTTPREFKESFINVLQESYNGPLFVV